MQSHQLHKCLQSSYSLHAGQGTVESTLVSDRSQRIKGKIDMADVTDLGWIQMKNHDSLFVNLNSTSSPENIIIGAQKETFNFVFQPAKYGAYGLLASSDLQCVIQVSSKKDSVTPAAHLTTVVSVPAPIVKGQPLPSNLDESMLFAINDKNGAFQIVNKKYSDFEKSKMVLTLYHANMTLNSKIVVQPDCDDVSQQWTFKTQLGTDTMVKFASKSGASPPARAVVIDAVSPQEEYIPDVSPNIIDGEWIVVIRGIFGMLTAGKDDPTDPSYKFDMKQVTSTNFKKDQLELCHCFARLSNISGSIAETIALQTRKYVYRDASPLVAYCPQHGSMKYTFQIYVPGWIGDKSKINVIFAQWHGMPNGLLFKIPQDIITNKYIVQGPLSPMDAASMWSRYGFKDGISASTPYSYVEQGGKPPLAIKFKDNKLQVACTGDSRWFSDKYVPGSDTKWKPSLSDDQHYKHQILYDGMPLDEFPLQEWVTLVVDVKWAEFTAGKKGVNQLGSVRVDMMDSKGTKHLVSEKICS